MAQLDLPPGLLPTLKDRLLDPDSMGTRALPGYGLQQIIASVHEDLEELLNTRRSRELPEAQYPELARSIASYGLPDFASLNTSSLVKREALGGILEKIITLHEPRLRNVRATMDTPKGPDLSATFHIKADLRVEPAPPMEFETVVQLTTGHVAIHEGPG
jgi:type VI secretion system protein ImpF